MTEIENSLRKKVNKADRLLTNMNDEQFKSFIKNLDSDELNVLLENYRDDRNFYKKILMEEYRKKNPNSVRYEEAETLLAIYNSQGKLLKTHIDSLNK